MLYKAAIEACRICLLLVRQQWGKERGQAITAASGAVGKRGGGGRKGGRHGAEGTGREWGDMECRSGGPEQGEGQ